MIFQGGIVSTGCNSSPENPTWILGVIGLFVGWVFSRWSPKKEE